MAECDKCPYANYGPCPGCVHETDKLFPVPTREERALAILKYAADYIRTLPPDCMGENDGDLSVGIQPYYYRDEFLYNADEVLKNPCAEVCGETSATGAPLCCKTVTDLVKEEDDAAAKVMVEGMAPYSLHQNRFGDTAARCVIKALQNAGLRIVKDSK